MILTVAAFLTLLGVGLWVIGSLADHQGIATIGAVLVVGVGAMMMSSGLEHKSGVTKVEVDNNTTEVTYEYSPVNTPKNLPLGPLVMLVGGLLVLHSLDPDS